MKPHIITNLRYPKKAIKKKIEGTVFLSFVVDTTGKVVDVKIIQGVHSSIDNEAIRVVKSLERWIPARQKGIKVKASYSLPIRFKI